MPNTDRAAQNLVDELADMFRADDSNKVYEFTPSVKSGRRYLAVGSDNLIYHICVEVLEQSDYQ